MIFNKLIIESLFLLVTNSMLLATLDIVQPGSLEKKQLTPEQKSADDRALARLEKNRLSMPDPKYISRGRYRPVYCKALAQQQEISQKVFCPQAAAQSVAPTIGNSNGPLLYFLLSGLNS